MTVTKESPNECNLGKRTAVNKTCPLFAGGICLFNASEVIIYTPKFLFLTELCTAPI